MFLQRTTSRRGDKVYVSWLVREGFRTERGPRSRTVANVTGLPEKTRSLIGLSLKGTEFVPLEMLELAGALDYGGVAVLRDLWQRCRLDELFYDVPKPRDRALLKAMVFGRLLFPSSKRALAPRARASLLAAACGLDQSTESFDEDALYAAMDALSGRWVTLEKRLFKKAFVAPVRVVLYDLTSVYFEGKGPKHLARYGYSRDHRRDRPQVLLAVATDGAGMPIHIEVLKGNRSDTTTLQALLTTLRRRFGLGKGEDRGAATAEHQVVFSFDGGMASKVNLASLEAEKLLYVTRLTKSQLGALLKRLPSDEAPELFDCTKILELEHEGRRYVLAGGAMRRYRDQQRRQTRIADATQKLNALAAVSRKEADPQKLASQIGRMLQRLNAHKYFSYHIDQAGQVQFSLKQDLIDEEAQLDGWYVLQTNLPAEAGDKGQVVAHYKQLIEVEAAFCEMKSYLEARPINHHRPDRVRNHIRICFLALWMSARLASEWKAKGEHRRVTTILRSLQRIRVGSLKLEGNVLRHLFTEIPPELNETLERLDLLRLFSSPPNWAEA
jgi:transposase